MAIGETEKASVWRGRAHFQKKRGGSKTFTSRSMHSGDELSSMEGSRRTFFRMTVRLCELVPKRSDPVTHDFPVRRSALSTIIDPRVNGGREDSAFKLS